MSIDDVKSLWKWVGSGAFLASMCCFPSVLLAGLGLMSIGAADALSKNMYFGPARWILYGMAAILITFGLIRYFKGQGICDINEVKRQRKRIINTVMIAIFSTIATYLIFNYVILELLGIAVGLPWEEDAFWN
ncbi:MAG: hypothetical protein QF440_06760 [Candidatus Thalassarchaeaceae archaeon]|nr:hypothetical protein [Candidatus Thalassarchaeaceae archaeon]